MRCVAAIVARNEADRYLDSVLSHLRPLCDEILLLDDQSTDGTAELGRSHGCQVKVRQGAPLWGQESTARQDLWRWGAEVAEDGWLLICDADQELVAPAPVWQTLCTSWVCSAWAFPLYDTWDTPTTHRTDGYWAAYRHKRPWLFRPSRSGPQVWSDRGVHPGHAPQADWIVGRAPESVWWRHRGYERRADRAVKLAQYTAEAAQLTASELAHAQSIGDV